MWEYHQETDVDTEIKISPQCHHWQSVCWFLLVGVKILTFLMAYLWPILILLIGLGVFAFISLRRKWNLRKMMMQQSIVENAVPEPEIPEPEEQMVQDPLVDEGSLQETPKATDTADQDKFQPKPKKPLTVKFKTIANVIEKETKPRQTQLRNTRTPVVNLRKGACIANKDQVQTPQRAVAPQRTPSVRRPSPMRNAPQNPGGARPVNSARKSDVADLFYIPRTPIWKW